MLHPPQVPAHAGDPRTFLAGEARSQAGSDEAGGSGDENGTVAHGPDLDGRVSQGARFGRSTATCRRTTVRGSTGSWDSFPFRCDVEIERMVLDAPRVERGVAAGTAGGGVQILGNRQTGAASATEHGSLIEPVPGPAPGVVVLDLAVTGVAGVPSVAAGKSDRDDVPEATEVLAASPRIHLDPVDARSRRGFRCGRVSLRAHRGHRPSARPDPPAPTPQGARLPPGPPSPGLRR